MGGAKGTLCNIEPKVSEWQLPTIPHSLEKLLYKGVSPSPSKHAKRREAKRRERRVLSALGFSFLLLSFLERGEEEREGL